MFVISLYPDVFRSLCSSFVMYVCGSFVRPFSIALFHSLCMYVSRSWFLSVVFMDWFMDVCSSAVL